MRVTRLAACVLAALLIGCGGPEARKEGYLTKGREYLASHHFEKARLEFRKALQLDPNDAEVSFLAGTAAEHLGNVREAAQMYQTAIQADGRHLGARAQMAKLFVLSGGP